MAPAALIDIPEPPGNLPRLLGFGASASFDRCRWLSIKYIPVPSEMLSSPLLSLHLPLATAKGVNAACLFKRHSPQIERQRYIGRTLFPPQKQSFRGRERLTLLASGQETG